MMRHPFQLRRIELRDFKSVAEANVELRPLTVVVGANSSGKSTLLQSILAVTQAVRSGASSADFPLNGEFVRLGTFDETHNFLAARPGAPMEIAFELLDTRGSSARDVGSDEESSRQPRPLQLSWRAYIARPGHPDASTVTPSGFARIASLQIEIGTAGSPGDGEVRKLLSCDVAGLDSASADIQGLEVVGRGPRLIRQVQVTAAEGRVQDWESGNSAAIDAVVLAGGVPQALLRRVGQFDRLAELWWDVAKDVLSESFREQGRQRARTKNPSRPNESAVTHARSHIRSYVSGEDEDVRTDDADATLPDLSGDTAASSFYKYLGRLDPEARETVALSMAGLGEAQFRSLLRRGLEAEPWIADEVLVEQSGRAGAALWRAGFVSQRFFRSGVRYLGPLREAPHVLYDPGPSKLDLGVRGEYAAAVLHAQAAAKILMPTPGGPPEERSLGDALDFWLHEFGLADQARSEDRGRIGIGLSVTPSGIGRPVDLTSVGVGVGQILPVILLCLLAEPGVLIVLEQPELHLHPKLQHDLADFLLACARSGRQLVVETHSEHLVNRLRRRIAEDDTDETRALLGLVFAECEEGITSYREPEVNQYGGLSDDRPAGFLDLSVRESQELVKRSLAKRKRHADSEDR